MCCQYIQIITVTISSDLQEKISKETPSRLSWLPEDLHPEALEGEGVVDEVCYCSNISYAVLIVPCGHLRKLGDIGIGWRSHY